MSASLVAVDYSRPIQPLLQQAPRIATIHSVFQRAVNIALDDTMLALLSSELPSSCHACQTASGCRQLCRKG